MVWLIALKTEAFWLYMGGLQKKLSAHRLNFYTGFMFKDESATSVSVAVFIWLHGTDLCKLG